MKMMNVLKSFAALWVCVCLGWLAFGPTAEREAARRDLYAGERDAALAVFAVEVETKTREMAKLGDFYSPRKYELEHEIELLGAETLRELRRYRATPMDVQDAMHAGVDAARR